MANSNENPRLERYIDDLLDREVFPTRGDIAKTVGMTDSGFSRAVREEGTLSIEACLHLADYLGEPPATILRLANREALAKKVDNLWKGKEFQLTRREREHIRTWRLISAAERHIFESLLQISAQRARAGSNGRRRTKRR